MAAPKHTEAELAAVVVAWLQDSGAEVYQEVEMAGGVADIVARVSAELWIIETKLHLSLALLVQAMERRRHAHRVYCAGPHTRTLRDFAGVCREDATYAAACDPPIARVVVFPQALLDGYRADFFASLHIEHRGETLVTWMAIECDGHAWHERTPQQAAYDRARDRALLRGCVPTIRFTGSEINRDANQCAREALDVLRALAVREMNIITDHAYNIALKYTDEAFAEVRKEREATAAATEGR